MSKSMRILFDADMLVFRMCRACEEWNPFDKSVLEKADPEETWRTIELRAQQCIEIATEYFDTDVHPVFCFSSHRNYRKEINPDYKSNRKDPKPVLYNDMKAKCERLFDCEEWDGLEADDVMGILQTEDTIICSGDKDMRQIEGYHLNLIDPELGIERTTPKEGDALFRNQCLSGDATDGYYGCPSIGKVKAKQIIDTTTNSNWWSIVVQTYRDAMSPKSRTETTEGGVKRTIKLRSVNRGLTEADALLTARMAYILRNEDDYDKEKHEVKLWAP